MGNPGVHTALDEEVVVAVMCMVVWVRGCTAQHIAQKVHCVSFLVFKGLCGIS